jgi:Tol biopolymer transport system component
MQQGPRAWSPDGRLIVFQKAKVPKGAVAPLWNLWVLSLSGDRKPFPYIESPFSQSEAALSPNGRWLAYVSNESGKYDVIVQPFPDPSGGKWQISTQGGAYPRWKRDGREIYYVTPSGGMIAVAVMTAPTFDIGKSTLLFQTPLAFSGDPGGSPYDVTSDGQQFLMSVPAANASPITVVLNWSEGLTK